MPGEPDRLRVHAPDGLEDVLGTIYRTFAVRYPGHPTDVVTSRSWAERRLRPDAFPEDSVVRARLEIATANDRLDAVRRDRFRLGYDLTFECRSDRLELRVWDDGHLASLVDGADTGLTAGTPEVVVVVTREADDGASVSLRVTIVRALERVYETDVARIGRSDGGSGCPS